MPELRKDPTNNHSYPGSGSRRRAGKTSKDHYHWHIEITPRLTELGGFEQSSGFYINTVSPERSAATLREIAL
jgi:galactose-1-phosphate uridylyltransferase